MAPAGESRGKSQYVVTRTKKNDDDQTLGHHSADIPSVHRSEEEMFKKADSAIRVISEYKELDDELLEMLGLGSYYKKKLKEEQDGNAA